MGDVHNAIKYDTGLANAVGVGAGLSRDQGGLERISETLQPSVDVYTLPEWQLLRGSYRAAAQRTAAAVPAEFSAVALINAAGTGVLAVVTGITMRGVAAAITGQIEVTTEAAIRAALAGSEVKGLYTDRRRTATSTRLTTLDGSEATSIGGDLEQITESTAAVRAFSTSLPIILPPGQGVLVRGGTLNANLQVNYGWYERQALPGELSAT